MYTPKHFAPPDQQQLLDLIKVYPLASIVTQTDTGLDACHAPFLCEATDSGLVLQSHIAKANPLWQQAQKGQQVLLIFNGPNAYISPNYYPSKQQTHKAVPTWNYSVAHVKGQIYFNRDPSWLKSFLERFTAQQEATSQEIPWSLADAPADYIERLTTAIVGIEVLADSIEGNFKLSQNKSAADIQGVIDGLSLSLKIKDKN